MPRPRFRWVIFAGALALSAPACGGSGIETFPTTTTTGAGTGTGGNGGAGGATGSTSSTTSTTTTGTGGAGGATGGDHGPSASALVSGGAVCKSPSYELVITVGQSTPSQTKTTSPSYQMEGGLIGALGTLP